MLHYSLGGILVDQRSGLATLGVKPAPCVHLSRPVTLILRSVLLRTIVPGDTRVSYNGVLTLPLGRYTQTGALSARRVDLTLTAVSLSAVSGRPAWRRPHLASPHHLRPAAGARTGRRLNLHQTDTTTQQSVNKDRISLVLTTHCDRRTCYYLPTNVRHRRVDRCGESTRVDRWVRPGLCGCESGRVAVRRGRGCRQ